LKAGSSGFFFNIYFVKKFSKITENKQFFDWSKERLFNEFKSGLNPIEMQIELMYVSKDDDCSTCWNQIVDKNTGLTDIERFNGEDKLFSPMFMIVLVLGQYPTANDFHQVNDVQVDNWTDESIKIDLLFNEIKKLDNFLEKYKNDFFIYFERSSMGKFQNEILTKSLLTITISLIMKDEFEYEQIENVRIQ